MAWGRELVEVNFQGEPKAIPWTHGTPLKAAADGWCHMDICKGYVVAWPTNLGWMMGPWLVYASLLNGASMALYNGSPLGSGFAKFVQLKGCGELFLATSEVAYRHWEADQSQAFFIVHKPDVFSKEGIGHLKSLQFPGFVGCGNLKSLSEGMQGLTALRTLLISDCRNLEFLPSGTKHLTALETLSIENCEKPVLTEWEEDNEDLRLSLQTVLITTLPQLETLPQWLRGAKDTLQLISIQDCWDLKALPEWLQHLTWLLKLEISLCPRLWALPEGMCYLTALRELKIEDCPDLNRRCKEGTGKDRPKIAHVPKIVLLERTSEMFRKHKRMLNKLLFLNQ